MFGCANFAYKKNRRTKYLSIHTQIHKSEHAQRYQTRAQTGRQVNANSTKTEKEDRDLEHASTASPLKG